MRGIFDFELSSTSAQIQDCCHARWILTNGSKRCEGNILSIPKCVAASCFQWFLPADLSSRCNERWLLDLTASPVNNGTKPILDPDRETASGFSEDQLIIGLFGLNYCRAKQNYLWRELYWFADGLILQGWAFSSQKMITIWKVWHGMAYLQWRHNKFLPNFSPCSLRFIYLAHITFHFTSEIGSFCRILNLWSHWTV